MLKQLRNRQKNNKGQNTAEYALLIALVIASVIAIQQYAQRSLQARLRDAGTYMTEETAKAGLAKEGDVALAAYQYEPYYQQSNYTVSRNATENKRLGEGLSASDAVTNRTRTGEQRTTYSSVFTTGEPKEADLPSGL